MTHHCPRQIHAAGTFVTRQDEDSGAVSVNTTVRQGDGSLVSPHPIACFIQLSHNPLTFADANPSGSYYE